ncbi:MAG TPA: 23S rRNA (adenine(2503)-C(2))-methyltransferase RlmN [Candidatus Binataceae bacterium]|nr:23S rRNA (adenine(2503)-C(2))-methyltransferase RlmN [Candidatus Binataceae bacterium]
MTHAGNAIAPSRSSPLRPDLRELLPTELDAALRAAGAPAYRARQLAVRLWRQAAASFDEMRELPAPLREYLKENFKLEVPWRARRALAADGTRKLLLELADGERIESVLIPTPSRLTLCLSTQAGCAMGCTFCATARMNLRRNLTAAEILGQIVAARRELAADEAIANYVFMGMGEPLANYPRLKRALTIMTADWGMGISPRRITVSTVGLVPMMLRLLSDFQVNLAVSLHATTDELRTRLAPINRRYPLATLLEACRELPLQRRRRITFEYVMLDGINDSPADARRLAQLLARLPAKVNLIMFNPFAAAPFRPSARPRVEEFQAILQKSHLTATIRESRGQDIAAACGQLYSQAAAATRAAAQGLA